MLNNNELSLKNCMEERIKKIAQEEKNYETVKSICKHLSEDNFDFNTFDYQKYYEKINVLGKEGFTMRNVKTDKKKKIMGAILSSSVFSIFFISLIVLISYFQFTESSKMPWILYAILICFFAMPLIGLIVNLIARIEEILGGEEDEASKY